MAKKGNSTPKTPVNPNYPSTKQGQKSGKDRGNEPKKGK